MARASQKRKQGDEQKTLRIDWRKLLRLSAYVLVLGGLLGGAWQGVATLRQPSVLPLQVVRIDGDFQYLDRAQLERAVAKVINGNFITVNLEIIRRSAMELPWVEQVTVRRQWPDTLEMVVVEREPLARWGKEQLVSRQGVVFHPQDIEKHAALPRLSGPLEAAAEVVQRYHQYQAVTAVLDLKIEKLKLDSRGAWSLAFENGLVVMLGKAEQQQRLEKFGYLYPLLRDTNAGQMKRVDMRYTNGAAVLWSQDKASAGRVKDLQGKSVSAVQDYSIEAKV